MTRFSVVIPTFNRERDLERVLKALEEQGRADDCDLEIVVVDDGSEDGTKSLLKSWKGAGRKALSQANSGPARARNAGVEAASGDVVAFLGDDTIPQPGWIIEHREAHRLWKMSAPVAILGFTSFPAEIATPFLRWINEYGAQFGYSIIEDPQKVPFNFFYTSNISLPRAFFLEQGGFREDFPAAAWEDIEFAYRAFQSGLRILYHPRARTIHCHRIQVGTFCRRQRTVGRSGAIFAGLHPELNDFLGVQRLEGRRRLSALTLGVLAGVARLGESVPGIASAAVYRRLLDEHYLQGLAEGLHPRVPG